MNATTNTTAPATAADLLAQAGNIGADLATSVPATQVPAEAGKTVKEVIAESAASGIEVVKAATDKAMGFVAEHKTGFIIGAFAAGASYGLYKWHKKRQAAKAEQAKAEQAKAEEAKTEEAKA